jgi:hypothetical protein
MRALLDPFDPSFPITMASKMGARQARAIAETADADIGMVVLTSRVRGFCHARLRSAIIVGRQERTQVQGKVRGDKGSCEPEVLLLALRSFPGRYMRLPHVDLPETKCRISLHLSLPSFARGRAVRRAWGCLSAGLVDDGDPC